MFSCPRRAPRAQRSRSPPSPLSQSTNASQPSSATKKRVKVASSQLEVFVAVIVDWLWKLYCVHNQYSTEEQWSVAIQQYQLNVLGLVALARRALLSFARDLGAPLLRTTADACAGVLPT